MEKILIVVDIQKDFVDGALGTPEAVVAAQKAAEKIRNFTGTIYVTYDTHFEDYAETAEGKALPVPHCIKDSDGWQLHGPIADALEGKEYGEIEKLTFGSVDLPEVLAENHNVEDMELEIIGLCTDICVVSNALILKAHFPEIPITVDASCCAGVTPESHNAALTTLKMCQIHVINA